MQGWKTWIPTEQKIDYINSLLKVGFDTIDFGSFVSEKAIPQMKDTAQVLSALDLTNTNSKLLAIVANLRGATEACDHPEIALIGFPFSISETFQKRNTNSSISESFEAVKYIQDLCTRFNKKLVIYISMGFGNPYGDVYNQEIVLDYVSKFSNLGIGVISLSDTVGLATTDQISSILKQVIPQYKKIEIGVHLHSNAASQEAKIFAALNAGCTRFDGALKGIGGCPMANDKLVGNISTEIMIDSFTKKGINLNINTSNLITALGMAQEIFH